MSGDSIDSWEDKGKKLFGAFSGKRIVVGQDQDRVVAALDRINGKGEALKNDAILPANAGAGALLYIAGDELMQLAKDAKNQGLSHLKNGSLAIAEDKNGLVFKSRMVGEDEAAAQNVVKQIEGGKAALTFAANDDPDAALVSDVVSELKAKSEADKVEIDCPITFQRVQDLLGRFTGDVGK
jgi:hypothetical protein